MGSKLHNPAPMGIGKPPASPAPPPSNDGKWITLSVGPTRPSTHLVCCINKPILSEVLKQDLYGELIRRHKLHGFDETFDLDGVVVTVKTRH